MGEMLQTGDRRGQRNPPPRCTLQLAAEELDGGPPVPSPGGIVGHRYIYVAHMHSSSSAPAGPCLISVAC